MDTTETRFSKSHREGSGYPSGQEDHGVAEQATSACASCFPPEIRSEWNPAAGGDALAAGVHSNLSNREKRLMSRIRARHDKSPIGKEWDALIKKAHCHFEELGKKHENQIRSAIERLHTDGRAA